MAVIVALAWPMLVDQLTLSPQRFYSLAATDLVIEKLVAGGGFEPPTFGL
jgi:hypothetical protein